MKERGLCKYYECHGRCTKGKDADTLGLCQHCGKWSSAYRPVRGDFHKQKLERIRKKERYDYD